MKSNNKLGFEEIGVVESGDITLSVGRKGDTYRAYAYRYYSDQDASKSCITDEMCARDDTPMGAVRLFRERAIEAGWPRKSIVEVVASIEDELPPERTPRQPIGG